MTRIPANERQGRRHTSAVTVTVLAPPPPAQRLNPRDVEISYFRASGAGGQHRNKTETAVRAVHRPTGLSAVAASERSQSVNLERAMAVLSARVSARSSAAIQGKVGEDRRRQHGSGDIAERQRSYLFREGVAVDHRTGVRVKLAAALDGDLGPFAA